MNLSSNSKKLLRFARKNYIISIFAIIVVFTLSVAFIKIVFSEDEYVYAKVKVSQGLWWASTPPPNIWLVQSIKKGMIEKSLSGKPLVEVLNVNYYPSWESDQYNVYMTVKMKINKNENTGKYTFKRSSLGVSSPVDFEFPDVLVSGTIMGISESPFNNTLVEKTVTITNNSAYPFEFDVIDIGDTYTNGEQVVLEVLDKESAPSSYLSRDRNGNYTGTYESREAVTVKLKMLVEEQSRNLIYGDEQIIRLGKTVNLSTEHFTFAGYVVEGIE